MLIQSRLISFTSPRSNILSNLFSLILRLQQKRVIPVRLVCAAGLSVLLCACGFSNPMIKSETMSFDDAIEDTTDKLLVLNVLRARDQAPLHFANIPSISESIQQSSSLSIANLLGARNGSISANGATAGLGFQMNPTFSISHINSKEFVTGMASPIDPKFVKYWLDRGLDRRIILLLFFSSAEITDTENHKKIKITNTPRESVDKVAGRKGECLFKDNCPDISQFELYLHLVNKFKQFDVKLSPPESKLMGGPFEYNPKDTAGLLQTIAALEKSKLNIKLQKNPNQYYLCQTSGEPQVRLININGTKLEAGNKSSSDVCNRPYDEPTVEAVGNTVPPKDIEPVAISLQSDTKNFYELFKGYEAAMGDTKKKNPTVSLTLQIRSVGEMIHFLGDLLYYQETLSKPSVKKNPSAANLHNPVTLGHCPESENDEKMEGRWDTLFNLADADNDPVHARFELMYRSKKYAVGIFDDPQNLPPKNLSCKEDFYARKDHTLEILAVLHQLVDLNQSATDIRETPFVKVLP